MQLLEILADGKFHSGEELGALLGVSRAAVWKKLSTWRRRGVELEVVRGKGYRLMVPIERWSADQITSHISVEIAAIIDKLVVEERVGSTNDLAARIMRESPRAAVVCLAEEQTAGRGRRGRGWVSPFGNNFYGSFGWIFPNGMAALEGLSLAVGVVIVRVLRRHGVKNAQLKWPNDIVVGGAKLGGVLIEVLAEAGGQCQVIVGLGLNVSLSASISERVGRAVTDVAAHVQRPFSRNEFGAQVIEEVVKLLRDYSEIGFSGFEQEWSGYDALRGEEVITSGLNEEIAGIARGVSQHGALKIETPSGIRLISGGEVSLRKRSDGLDLLF